MFDLKRPCVNCPFRKGEGEKFGFSDKRMKEILNAVAFQCHKTVDYRYQHNSRRRQGKNPQQCAGLMAVLHREGRDNAIMQVAKRTIGFDASTVDPDNEAYGSIQEAMEAHDV